MWGIGSIPTLHETVLTIASHYLSFGPPNNGFAQFHSAGFCSNVVSWNIHLCTLSRFLDHKPLCPVAFKCWGQITNHTILPMENKRRGVTSRDRTNIVRSRGFI
ncbi:hypothetical protein I7I50_07598 [Histoplasma capsulatum G186AR]|uniref:Uncharacterized protein n=1 Tax=Ajellomyces capsulatus TaxID=5037 RepID=A0A8H8D346_AJECA|nr:hypothetical protein I7I52_09330 [Histoplasma capsulatum]QSS68248.1 hypothetical protein I7I50_07598 [Histoplasma capsulatum G186AR]